VGSLVEEEEEQRNRWREEDILGLDRKQGQEEAEGILELETKKWRAVVGILGLGKKRRGLGILAQLEGMADKGCIRRHRPGVHNCTCPSH
jgi:hypothetical protein